jgi:hypothetical protein
MVAVATKSLNNEIFTKITVCIYPEKIIERGRYYGISQIGNSGSRPTALNENTILDEVNTHYKHIVAKLNGLEPISYVETDFDKNRNGVIDFYNDGTNPETAEIYRELLSQQANASSIVLIKDKIRDVWRIRNTINVGDTIVNITSSSDKIQTSETFSIAHPNGSDIETFRITSASANQLIIDIDPYTAGNQGFLKAHPKTNDDTSSHSITSAHTVAGLSPNKLLNRPALVVLGANATEGSIAKIFAHELMHAQQLEDVDEVGNMMYYKTGTLSIKPFVFKLLNVVITGTNTSTGVQQNQWETITR